MALSLASASAMGFAPTGAVRAPSARAATPVMESIADLEELAPKLNPVRRAAPREGGTPHP